MSEEYRQNETNHFSRALIWRPKRVPYSSHCVLPQVQFYYHPIVRWLELLSVSYFLTGSYLQLKQTVQMQSLPRRRICISMKLKARQRCSLLSSYSGHPVSRWCCRLLLSCVRAGCDWMWLLLCRWWWSWVLSKAESRKHWRLIPHQQRWPLSGCWAILKDELEVLKICWSFIKFALHHSLECESLKPFQKMS